MVITPAKNWYISVDETRDLGISVQSGVSATLSLRSDPQTRVTVQHRNYRQLACSSDEVERETTLTTGSALMLFRRDARDVNVSGS